MASSTTTEVEVANEALLYVGVSQTVNDFDESTAEAKACKAFFAKTRDALLEKFWWKFATSRSFLALLSSEERSNWAYTYALPANCIAPRYIDPGVRNPREDQRIPFDLEALLSGAGVVNGLCLVTDQPDAELVYTARVENVALWSPGFVTAMAWHLAVQLALVLPIKPELATRALAMAKVELGEAKVMQLRGHQPDLPAPSEYTTAR